MLSALAFGVALAQPLGGERLAQNGRRAREKEYCRLALIAHLEAVPAKGTAGRFPVDSRSAANSQNRGRLPGPQLAPLRADPAVGPDPEISRIQAELKRIEQDPAARESFYSGVELLIRRVRSRQPIPQQLTAEAELPMLSTVLASHASGSGPPSQASFRPEAGLLPAPGGTEAKVQPASSMSNRQVEFSKLSPATNSGAVGHRESNVLRPSPLDVKSLVGPTGRALDSAVVSRIVYWAQVNECPLELALATAWQESRMSPHPAHSSAGAVGIMQILPDRARLEGVDPANLEDPEINLRLGTKLLARYYQEEGSIARAAMKYVAGPGVFDRHYGRDVQNYIASYSTAVKNYAGYFGTYLQF
jgi:hypothetical protein